MAKKSDLKTKLIILIIICVIINILLIIGVILSLVLGSLIQDFNNGCFLRYSFDDKTNTIVNNVQTFNREINLQANASYNNVYNSATNTFQSDNKYGQWLQVGIIEGNQQIKVTGAVSLCKAYLPSYDLQSGAAANPAKLIEIPRVEDPDAKTLSLYFPANTGEWRNITEIYEGDNVQVKVAPVITANNLAQINQDPASNFKLSTNISNVTILNAFTEMPVIPYVNCSSNIATNVSPLCSRFSPFNKYASGCEVTEVNVPIDRGYCTEQDTDIVKHTCASYFKGKWYDNIKPCCNTDSGCYISLSKDSGTCFKNTDNDGPEYTTKSYKEAPSYLSSVGLSGSATAGNIQSYINANAAAYGPVYKNFSNDDTVVDFTNRIFPHKNDIAQYSNILPQCTNPPSESNTKNAIANYKFWLTNGDGLMYRLAATNPVPINSNYANDNANAKMLGAIDSNNAYLYNNTLSSEDMGGALGLYLQYRYIDKGNFQDNTGGYVLSISHTKCQRVDGKAIDDSGFNDRGRVEYIIAPGGVDLNQDNNAALYIHSFLDFSLSNQAVISFNNNLNDPISAPTLWLRIKNKPVDYPDSMGQYKVEIGSKSTSGKFTELVLNPIINTVVSTINSVGTQLFKNATCYGQDADKTSCTNFFNYIRAMLTLYVMLFGMMFLLGKSQLNQEEFIIRIVKIVIVAGLMNEDTFELLSGPYLQGITQFSDQLIANLGGYAITFDADGNMSNNPFEFLDDVMSRIFFNKMFLYQMFSLMGIGLSSIAILCMTLLGVTVFVVGTMQAIGAYILAKLALSFLFGIAPLFLTFMLFEPTRELFTKWLSNVIKFTIETLVVILGLAMLAQLYTVYLDNTLSFSVCFKCAIPFNVPTLSLTNGIPGNFKNLEIFCLPWFVPWGNSPSSAGNVSVSLPDLAGLLMVAFINWHYVNYAASIVTSITGQVDGPSTASMGANAGKAFASTIAKGAKAGGKKIYSKINRREISKIEGKEKPIDTEWKSAKPSALSSKDNIENKATPKSEISISAHRATPKVKDTEWRSAKPTAFSSKDNVEGKADPTSKISISSHRTAPASKISIGSHRTTSEEKGKTSKTEWKPARPTPNKPK